MTDFGWPCCKNTVPSAAQQHRNYVESRTVQKQCLNFGFGTMGANSRTKECANYLRLFIPYLNITQMSQSIERPKVDENQ
jgi:hypothetical protein